MGDLVNLIDAIAAACANFIVDSHIVWGGKKTLCRHWELCISPYFTESFVTEMERSHELIP